MPKITLQINGENHALDVPSDMALLWALRDELNMKDIMFNCGMGFCGACTVLVDSKPRLSCQTKAVEVAGHSITTIKGLNPAGNNPVQRARNDEDTPQSGNREGV